MDKKIYLLKNTLIFAISIFSTKLITFFLVPLYTNSLTPEEYGIVDLLFTISSFLYPLFTLNISEAIYRFSMEEDCNHAKIYNIGITCFILCVLLGLITLPVLNCFDVYKQYALYFYVYLITLSLAQILLVSLKGREKLKLFNLGNIINTLGIALLNIIFLVVLKYGIDGYFISYIIANIITIIFGITTTKFFKNVKSFKFDKKLFLEMIKYSVILIPTSFMWWITNSSDRVMVSSFVGNHATGLYAISYKIPSLLTVVASIFNQAWIFSAIKEKNNSENESFTNNIFKLLFFIIALLSLIILIIIKPLFKVYVAAEYFVAWKYVPILIIGFIFMTLATFISTSYNVYKDSKGFLYSGLVGALSNIIMNFILIPKFGVYGAAVATLFSYVMVFIYRLVDTKKYLKIHISFIYYINLLIIVLCSIFVYLKSNVSYVLNLILLFIYIIVNRKTINEMINYGLSFIRKKIKTN